MTNADLVKILDAKCADEVAYMVATRLGISPTYLSDVRKGKREVSEQLARKLGFVRKIVFEPVGEPQ